MFEVPVAPKTENSLLQVNRCDTVRSLQWRTQQEGSTWALRGGCVPLSLMTAAFRSLLSLTSVGVRVRVRVLGLGLELGFRVRVRVSVSAPL